MVGDRYGDDLKIEDVDAVPRSELISSHVMLDDLSADQI